MGKIFSRNYKSCKFVAVFFHDKIKLNKMSMWRNRYTRTFEGRVEQSVRVQVPPSTFFIVEF